MGVTRIVDLINSFLVQCCISVGKSGHERVKMCYTGGKVFKRKLVHSVTVVIVA